MYSTLFEKFNNEETVFEEKLECEFQNFNQLDKQTHLFFHQWFCCQDKFWQELVDVAQATAGAAAVYIGVQEPGEEASL